MNKIKKLFELIKINDWEQFANIINNDKDNLIDLNLRDQFDNYLINYAIINNKPLIVDLLISHGSKIDMTDENGRTLLYIPIKYNFFTIIEILLKYNKNNIGLSIVDIQDQNYNTALHHAINSKNIEIVKLLLKYDSDIYVFNKSGYNAFHLAVSSDSIEICKLLIDKGININTKTKNGETSLHIACNFQFLEIVKLLIENNIDMNIQDYDNEFTALHYATNLNNIELFKLLLNNGADPNKQDYFGNNCLHYSIVDSNYEIIDILINFDKINFNIYNIDNKLPIHIMLEKNEIDNINCFSLILNKSLLNFQDNNGYTPMHHLSKNNQWINYQTILIKKKINIFIKNNDNMRPIDYINETEREKYLNLVTNSYLYILRNKKTIWKHTWQNKCKKELFFDKISNKEFSILTSEIPIIDKKKELCFQIVKNNLYNIYKNNPNSTCIDTSYPNDINKKCIKFDNNNIKSCTFTGITLDILVGLIYLLKKHKTACSTLNINFINNQKLRDHYKTIGKSSFDTEFLNFEIVWIHQKLYFSDNFTQDFNKCLHNNDKRFIIIPIGIELENNNHANYLIYDDFNKEIERFEPYGSHSPYKFNYNYNLLDKLLKYKFSEINKNIIYISPDKYMPKIGFQYLDSLESNTSKIGDPGGFCALWSIWYTDMRLTYYEISRKSLVKKLLKTIKKNNLSYKNLVRNYSHNITNLRDDILKYGNMDINDKINDNYSEEQFKNVTNKIAQIIQNL